MTISRWKQIWENNGKVALGPEARDEDTILNRLLVLNGYNNSTSQVTLDGWRGYARMIAGRVGIRSGDRLFEVGCGAGAFLYPFHEMGYTTDGIDYSAALVEVARKALPGARIDVGDALTIDPGEAYDIVLSQGVFLYFSDQGYAEQVLSRMVEKSRRGVAVLDVSDAALESEALALRRASYDPGEYDRRYAGLEHLYFERAWFEGFAESRGLTCVIESQSMPGYLSAKYRFNVFLSKS